MILDKKKVKKFKDSRDDYLSDDDKEYYCFKRKYRKVVKDWRRKKRRCYLLDFFESLLDLEYYLDFLFDIEFDFELYLFFELSLFSEDDRWKWKRKLVRKEKKRIYRWKRDKCKDRRWKRRIRLRRRFKWYVCG